MRRAISVYVLRESEATGVSMPCSRISKIDTFALTQKVVEGRVGRLRSPTRMPAAVEVDNIKVTLSEADIEPWMKWHKSFVVDGHCADSDELGGSIEILGPDMEEVLCRIDLAHVGLISLSPGDMEANSEKIQSWTAELYVEEVRFSFR